MMALPATENLAAGSAFLVLDLWEFLFNDKMYLTSLDWYNIMYTNWEKMQVKRKENKVTKL